jgi:purine-nucleoside phosphorylase
MLDLAKQIDQTVAAIGEQWTGGRAKVGLILGTGLGGLAAEIDQEAVIDYEEIPHFPQSTSLSHKGQLVCGKLEGVSVVAMEGRFHMYEGYSLQRVTLPVRVMKALGAEILVVSNACGGLNPYYKLGDIMVIDDQINLLGDNPLIGINDDNLGPRFPDMSQPYDFELIELAQQIARQQNLHLHRGVFVAVSGPNLETRAEYRFLRNFGADVVGMSTVPEVIVAVHSGMRSIGFSVITDLCFPDALQPADVQEIVRVANEAEPKLRKLVRGVLAKLG